MNKLDKQYQDLLQDILDNGVVKGDRTGTGTLSVFGRQIRHKMKDGFPLLTTKKMPFKNIATELIWFLKGDTNIKYLVDNGCNIWNGDAYKNYTIEEFKSVKKQQEKMVQSGFNGVCLEPNVMSMETFINKIKTDEYFSKKWGELGPVYGKQWRNWESVDKDNFVNLDNLKDEQLMGRGVFYQTKLNDQISDLIDELKNNPDSRRLIVNAWNVGDLEGMVLPPCHYGFQLYTRELTSDEWIGLMIEKHNMILEGGDENLPKRAISLMWNQRSVDTFLGLPFNIASYGILLEIIAKEVNMVPDELIGNLGDTHLYSNHLEQAKEQIGRESFKLPTIEVNDSWKFSSSSPVFADNLKLDMFELINYQSQGVIKAPLSN